VLSNENDSLLIINKFKAFFILSQALLKIIPELTDGTIRSYFQTFGLSPGLCEFVLPGLGYLAMLFIMITAENQG
jgi:hypothetical protein